MLGTKEDSMKLRFIFLTILFVMTFASFSSTPKVQAQTRTGTEFDYYSDDTFTDLVGVRGWCSNGQSYGFGDVTPYRIVTDSGC